MKMLFALQSDPGSGRLPYFRIAFPKSETCGEASRLSGGSWAVADRWRRVNECQVRSKARCKQINPTKPVGGFSFPQKCPRPRQN